MAESQETPQLGIEELNRTIEEYRAKVEELVQKEREKARHLASTESNSIIEGAWQKAEDIIARSQKEAQKNRDEIEDQAKKEASRIVNEAKYQAQQIVSEAEAREKKEANKRTKLEVKRIISEAGEEANSIISHAEKAAEKEASEIINRAKADAEQIINNEVEKCRLEAQVQIDQDIAEAQKRAKRVVDDGIYTCTEVYDMVEQIIKKTETIVDGFKTELQRELGELTQVISSTGKKMEQLTSDAPEGSEVLKIVPDLPEGLEQEATLLVQLEGANSGKKKDGDSLFQGLMKLKADSSCDYKQIRRLRDFLLHIPNIKFTGEFISEEETTISLEVQEPLPLLDILRNVPSVEKLFAQGDGARLVLNSPSK